MSEPRVHGRPALARVALYVGDIDAAVAGYELVLGISPVRVGPGRVYFHCDGAILVCVDPAVEAHVGEARPNGALLYFAVDDVDAAYDRSVHAGFDIAGAPTVRPWGERSFYADDPWGNRLCLVEAAGLYTGLESDSNR